MEDKYLINAEHPPAMNAPHIQNGQAPMPQTNGQIPVGQAPPPYGQSVVTMQPGSMNMQHDEVDESLISNINTKAIISIVFSAIASCCGWSICCAVPALVLAGMALGGARENTMRANKNANVAVILTVIAIVVGILILVLFTLQMVAYFDEVNNEAYHFNK